LPARAASSLFGVVGRACRHLIVRHSKVKKIVFKKQPKKSIKISLLQKRFTEVPLPHFLQYAKYTKTRKKQQAFDPRCHILQEYMILCR
jgi:hypothetical protein